MTSSSEQFVQLSSEQEPGPALFKDLIPDVVVRSENFRVKVDELDTRVFRAFEEQMRSTVDGLRSAVDVGDATAIRRHAHSLQGMGGMAGAPEVSVVGEELSRSAKQEDMEQCRRLTARLEQWRAQRGESCIREYAAPTASSTVAEQKIEGRILVVDDEAPNRLYLQTLLAPCGATMTEADTGEAALDMARRNPPDLMLVDVMMPGISGYEVCRQLMQDPITQHVAVIMVTARTTAEDVEHAFDLGAFDYIRKPFNARELLARVRNALQLKRQSDELRLWQTRMKREMDAAGALQRKLFSNDPVFTEELEVRRVRESSLSVGGDVLNAMILPDNRLCVYVGDVAGHGVGPAMVSTLLKALLDEVVADYAHLGPAAICNLVHERFKHYVANPEMYATLCVALLEHNGRCVSFNCGHPLPLLFDGNGASLPFLPDRGGLPIGLASGKGPAYEHDDEVRIELPPGGLMALYTDGLVEARHAQSGRLCGIDTLSAILGMTLQIPGITDPPGETLRRLGEAGYALAADDCTVLTIARADPTTTRVHRYIRTTHDAVADLAREVRDALTREQWPQEAVGAAQLLVTEHGANVVDHAGIGPYETIAFRMQLSGDTARFLFSDTGREWPFQRGKVSGARPNAVSERGRGLHIIRSVSSHTDAVRQGNKNIYMYTLDRSFTVESNEQPPGSITDE